MKAKHLALSLAVFGGISFAAPVRAQIQFGMPANTSQEIHISGTVTDPAGAPASGVQMTAMPGMGMQREVRTDAAGHYDLTWQPFPNAVGMSYVLIARDLEHNLAVAHDIDEKSTNLPLRLKPGIVLTVRVEDTNGHPFPNANASVVFYTESGSGFGLNTSATTDAQGLAEVKALPQGYRLSVSVNAQGYAPRTMTVAAEETSVARYEFPKAILRVANMSIAGRVLDAAGQPVAGVNLNFYGQNQPGGNARSDEQGRFSYDKLADGRVNIQVDSPNTGSVSYQAVAGNTNVTIRPAGAAPAQLTVSGKVTDPSGSPAAGISIRIQPGQQTDRNLQTDSGGNYTVTWRPNGGNSRQSSLVARDVSHKLAVAVDLEEDTKTKDVQLEPCFTVTGTVKDQSGNPIPNSMITCLCIIGNSGASLDNGIRSDATGAFQYSALPPGALFSLNARADGYGTGNYQISSDDAQSGATKKVSIVLKAANATVSGMVVGPDDKPVVGAAVQAVGMSQGTSPARTDSKGHFNLKVVEGPLQLMASAPNYNGASTRARSSDTDIVIKLAASANIGNVGYTVGPRGGNPIVTGPTVALIAQPWTWTSIKSWPHEHHNTVLVLAVLQALALTAMAAGIFWFTRPKHP